MRLLKEGRIRDIFNVKDRGYGYSKVSKGEFEIYMATKNTRREVKLLVKEDDSDLGYEIVSTMHRSGVYSKPRTDNTYQVTELTLRGTGESTAILILAETNLDYLNTPYDIGIHLGEGKKYQTMLTEGSGYGLYTTNYTFDSWEDYVSFTKEGYRVVKESKTDYQIFINKRKTKLREQIADLQKELELLD